MSHRHTLRTMTHRHSDPTPEYLTPAETAALLRVSPRTLWRYQAAGKVAPHVLPSGHRRFLTSDIEQLMQRVSA